MSAIQTGICSICCGLIWAIVFAVFGFGAANPWSCWGYDAVAAVNDLSDALDNWNSTDWSSWSGSRLLQSTSWSTSTSSGSFSWDAISAEVSYVKSTDCWYSDKSSTKCYIDKPADVVSWNGTVISTYIKLDAATLESQGYKNVTMSW